MAEQPLKPILDGLLSKLTAPEQLRKSTLNDCWPEIAGRRLAGHTKARFVGTATVHIWVDDSTLAFELSQRYRPTLLRRLRHQFGEECVKDIRFFVGEIR